MVRLSHSAISKFKTCPAQFDLHYNQRIRDSRVGSALLFGSAIDESLNCIMLQKKKELTPEEEKMIKLDPFQVFDYQFSQMTINKEVEDMPTSLFLDYYATDFDEDLLQEEDLKRLGMFIKNAGYEETDPIKLFGIVKAAKKEGRIPSVDFSYFNFCNWLSLRRKGHMMIEAFKEKIMPEIEEVTSIQRKVELPNDDGDLIIGYIDFEAKFKGKEGVWTTDNKTSGKKYKQSDINEKGQLGLYDEFTQNGQAAYVVLIKKIKKTTVKTCQDCGEVTTRKVKTCAAEIEGKRCGGEFTEEQTMEIETQILFDEILEEAKDEMFEEIGEVLEDIKEGKFPQRRDECFQFGRKCAYFNFCRDGSTEGLSRV